GGAHGPGRHRAAARVGGEPGLPQCQPAGRLPSPQGNQRPGHQAVGGAAMHRIPLPLFDIDAGSPAKEGYGRKRLPRLAKHKEGRQAQRDFGRLLVFRSEVIKARLQAHGIDWRTVPLIGLQALSYRELETWLGKPHELAVLRHAINWSIRFVDAALANVDVVGRTPGGEPAIRGNPPVELPFEEASAYGTLGECLDATKSKSWGKLIGAFPVEPDFPFDGQRIQYVFHASSRYNRRFLQRRWLKRRLGKELRHLVGLAMGSTKREWLAMLRNGSQLLKMPGPGAAHGLAQRLKLQPGDFWRAVKGKSWLTLPDVKTLGFLF